MSDRRIDHRQPHDDDERPRQQRQHRRRGAGRAAQPLTDLDCQIDAARARHDPAEGHAGQEFGVVHCTIWLYIQAAVFPPKLVTPSQKNAAKIASNPGLATSVMPVLDTYPRLSTTQRGICTGRVTG
jgi:hypothetical protein